MNAGLLAGEATFSKCSFMKLLAAALYELRRTYRSDSRENIRKARTSPAAFRLQRGLAILLATAPSCSVR